MQKDILDKFYNNIVNKLERANIYGEEVDVTDMKSLVVGAYLLARQEDEDISFLKACSDLGVI